MSPKLFKADNMLFGNPYNFPNMYANQFVPTWEKTTIREKFTIEGKYDITVHPNEHDIVARTLEKVYEPYFFCKFKYIWI